MKSTTVASAFLGTVLVFIAGGGYAADKDDTRKLTLAKPSMNRSAPFAMARWERGTARIAYSVMLKKPASDLTTLSRKNSGVFPFARVFETIEGTHELKAHGTREMPIWGREYRSSKYYDDYLHDPESDRSYFARSRILALTEYIYRLQAK